MYTYLIYTLAAVVIILLLWTLGAYMAIRTIEEPKYTVVSVADGYEVRDYAPSIAATTTVGGADYDAAINEGFRRIADYIFGNNTAETGISMTAPVQETSKTSAPIAMTVPVLEQGNSTQRIVSFIMPSAYTMASIPKPNNPAVVLLERPAYRAAVLSFSWGTGASRVAAKKAELMQLLVRDTMPALTEPTVALYNPPFTPPFMRRNEVLVEISK
jgi:hypothetical protein